MLIFDSGVGGLSILKMVKIVLPSLHYIYVLDNEGFPYGNKTEQFIIQRAVEIIQAIQKIYPINIVIIACNTVSTIALSSLKKKFHLPIIGIFPDFTTAEKITKNNIIGLIATENTINSNYIKKLVCAQNSCNTIQVIRTNQLAVMAEKKVRRIKFSQKDLKNIFIPWINLNTKPDTIILGCTHFIFLKHDIQNILHCKSSINFIDSRKNVIRNIQHYFYNSYVYQKIKKNVFLYSKHNDYLIKLLLFLKEYQFEKIIHINLN